MLFVPQPVILVRLLWFSELKVVCGLQNNRLSAEVQSLESKLEASRDEIGAMRMSLDEARANSDRLHRESELVVANVNKWVQEQK